MADKNPQIATLFDRLSRNFNNESSAQGLVKNYSSTTEIQKSVLADLTVLFNAMSLSSFNEKLDDYEQVCTSVLNYGLADYTKYTVAGVDIEEIKDNVRQAILNFEPRIDSHTLQVKYIENEAQKNYNKLVFEIDAQLLNPPTEKLYLKTEIDFNLSQIHVHE